MTNKPRILGEGRMYFDGGLFPPKPPGEMRTMSGTFRLMVDMPPFRHAQIAQNFFGISPIPYLVGYNPQKLLPAPGSDPSWFRRDMLQLLGDQLGVSYSDLTKPWEPISPNEIIDFETATPSGLDFTRLYSHLDYVGRQEGSPTGRRVGMVPELAAPYVGWRHKRAVIVVNADYGDLEARVLAAYATPGVVAIQLDMGDTYGEIAYNQAITDAMLSCYIKPLPKPKAVKQNGRSASYLDHDPTKRRGKGRR